jgi:prepilin-type N-terminal cleavage/methylation domain-containing protein
MTIVQKHRNVRSGFSLIELVIVVVIIAIIGAIAIPKMSRGATGAAESALIQNLSVLRSALDLYQTENGGNYPTVANVTAALTGYNDGMGASATYTTTKDSTHIYGPYLRSIPTLPVGAAKGGSGIAAATAAGVGWLYDTTQTKLIWANTTATETDAKSVAYSAY